jgi:hypothetical protein
MSELLAPHLFLPLLCDHLRALGVEAEIDRGSKPRALWPGHDVGFITLKGGRRSCCR